MNIFTVLMLILICAAVVLAYWQFGGRQDIKQIRGELSSLRAAQKEFMENLREAVARAFDESRRGVQDVRERLDELSEETAAGLAQQLIHANDQLDALAERLEETAKAAKDATLKTAQTIERAIDVRVRRIGARANLLRVKAKATQAASAAEKRDFGRADELLAEAADLLRETRGTLGDDHAYSELLGTMKKTLHDATLAVRSHAENVRQKIEMALADADKLVGHLESDEGQAAKEKS